MRLVLIRHGESNDQLAGRGTGPASCAGLSEHGFMQVRSLADRLKNTGGLNDCQILFSSPILRARQTTDVLIEVLPMDAYKEDHGLCEIHLGAGDGLTSTAYRAKFGTTTAPGGERWEEFIARVHMTMTRYAEKYQDQTVVAVTHGGFIANAVIALFDIPRPGTGAWLDPDNTGLTEWHYTDAHWTMVHYNDTYHVKEK